MTNEEIAAIRSRAELATPGPWETISTFDGWFVKGGLDFSAQLGTGTLKGAWLTETIEANQSFIAHAREDVPTLLTALTNRDERIQQLESVIAVHQQLIQTAKQLLASVWVIDDEDVTWNVVKEVMQPVLAEVQEIVTQLEQYQKTHDIPTEDFLAELIAESTRRNPNFPQLMEDAAEHRRALRAQGIDPHGTDEEDNHD